MPALLCAVLGVFLGEVLCSGRGSAVDHTFERERRTTEDTLDASRSVVVVVAIMSQGMALTVALGVSLLRSLFFGVINSVVVEVSREMV